MTTKIMRKVMALAAPALALAGLAGPASAASCDRACLVGITDRYLAAVVAHDPSKVPLAPNVVFVENVKRMQPGDGLWKSATGGPTSFSIHVPDVAMQQAGWMGVVLADGKPMMLAIRLKVVDGKITEAEHLLAAPLGVNNPNIVTPRPALVTDVPASGRMAHDKLIGIGATYYDALDDNNGSESPFAADCQRRENGVTTAGEGAGSPPIKDANTSPVAHDCKGQIDSGSFIYIYRIENRRMIAADPETGLAMGISHFRHPFTNLPYQVKHIDGTTSERNAQNMPYKPFDMPAAHIFKVGPEGQIHEIEAVGVMAPFNAPSGWEGTSYASTWVQPK
jgi:hypothetical protein